LWTSQNASTGGSDEIIISFGGTTLFDEIDPAFPIAGGSPENGYTELSFTASASSTLSTFEYQGLNITGGTYFLDDVSINDLGPPSVPEPGTLGLLVAALVGFGALRCSRRFSVETLSL
jgi:hypothetical protein